MRTPGLTIHVRRGDVYREEPESRAFPGWRAEEIHRALTESPLSETAWRALERVALSMGAREGTKPEDNPLTRSLNAKARTEGREQGHREGHEHGMREGMMQGREQGLEQGLAHERTLLRRMAASRFGTDTAERLGAVLAGIPDPERLAGVGERLVRCETGDAFLSRVAAAGTETDRGDH